MPLQMRQPQERQVTVRTLVRFQPRMCLHVTSEVLFVQKRPLARWTLDRTSQVHFGLGLDERLEIDLGRMVLGLGQYGGLVLVHMLVHHHLRAQHGRMFERRVVVRRVVLARHLECPGIGLGRAGATVCLQQKHIRSLRSFCREIGR